jgi:hypothetical protein
MYNIAIQHGNTLSLVEVFRDATLLFRTLGTREFISVETSEYVKRLVATGPSKPLEESIEGDRAARHLKAQLEIATEAGASAVARGVR